MSLEERYDITENCFNINQSFIYHKNIYVYTRGVMLINIVPKYKCHRIGRRLIHIPVYIFLPTHYSATNKQEEPGHKMSILHGY